MALYGSVYLLPVYLSQMQGYNSEQVGMVLAWTGLPQLVLIPFVPLLMRHIDTRLLVAVGFGLFALSCFMNLEITPDYAGDQLFVPNLVRALGQALVLTPLSALATGGIERENAGSASAMFNMMRNLGGSVGIAVLETFVTKREQFHSSIITARAVAAGPGDPRADRILARTFPRGRSKRSRHRLARRGGADRTDRSRAILSAGLQRRVLPDGSGLTAGADNITGDAQDKRRRSRRTLSKRGF